MSDNTDWQKPQSKISENANRDFNARDKEVQRLKARIAEIEARRGALTAAVRALIIDTEGTIG